MKPNSPSRTAGFTIGELMIGVSLSIMIMGAVLSSYVFVARAYTRTIGFGLPNSPTLEGQGRITLATVAQDVQVASDLSNPSASQFTLTVPRSTGGTKTVTYYYNSTAAAVSVTFSGYTVSVPANSLARIDPLTSTYDTLHSSLLTCVFTYYDAANRPYTANYTDHLVGIKQITFVLTAQTGSSTNGTLTQTYRLASPRMVFRNRSLLP